MSFKYCPNCGLKRKVNSAHCSNCQFNFNSISFSKMKDSIENRNNQSVDKPNVLFSVISFMTNTIFIFWYVWLYFITKETITRGDSEIQVITYPILLALFFYILSAILYFRKGGFFFWISVILVLIMIVPEVIFLFEFKEFYNSVGNIYGDIDSFLVISAIPLFFSLIICACNVVIIFLRLIKKPGKS
ncbi:hypothetical protein BK139_14885 [Paenibacillus sp. FSL R5-0490]|uniref:hypothetical protein n=1 Tax=Paenibacillus sp. FSL R5-0490 TaxID=1920424 RepID=UPI00096FC15E|nr:hypothetical protein [Paenibacillus sp. FSL R5-0490]OMF56581.1 hypothetical protein BK139_14885 [Paenibacillus sp. FSL R5-0490]